MTSPEPIPKPALALTIYFMPPSFREWLKSPDEALAADRLATLIARAGPAGGSSEDLGEGCGFPSGVPPGKSLAAG